MIDLTFRRGDGTFVALVNGHPYHIVEGDPLYAEAVAQADAMGEDLPPEPVPDPIHPEPRTEGSFREFMALFTEAEQDAIYAAALATANNGDFALTRWLDRARGGATMRLNHSDTIAGMATLVSAGLLAQPRADEILSADFDAA